MILKNSLRTSKKTQHFTITTIKWFVLLSLFTLRIIQSHKLILKQVVHTVTAGLKRVNGNHPMSVCGLREFDMIWCRTVVAWSVCWCWWQGSEWGKFMTLSCVLLQRSNNYIDLWLHLHVSRFRPSHIAVWINFSSTFGMALDWDQPITRLLLYRTSQRRTMRTFNHDLSGIPDFEPNVWAARLQSAKWLLNSLKLILKIFQISLPASTKTPLQRSSVYCLML
jgi:hypothetical protein